MPRPALITLLLPLTLLSCRGTEKDLSGHTAMLNRAFYKGDSISVMTHSAKAADYIDSVYATLPWKDAHDLYRLYTFKRYVYFNANDIARQLLYADSALDAVNGEPADKQHSLDFIGALCIKGDVLAATRNYREAFGYYFRARQLGDKDGDSCSGADYCSSLGVTCYRQGRYVDAARYFLEAYRRTLSCPSPDAYDRFGFLQGRLDDVALGYAGAGMLDSAIFFYDSARDFILHRQGPFLSNPALRQFIDAAMGVIDGNEGTARYRQGDTARAEALFRKSMSLTRGPETGDAQFTGIKLAQLYLDQNRLPEAEKQLAWLRLSLDSLPHPDAELRYLQTSRRLNDRLGRSDLAYRDLQAYIRLKDSLANASPINALDIDEQLKYVRADFNLQLLQKRDELKNVLLIVATLFTAMALTIISLVIQNARRSKAHVRTLTTRNQQMHNALSALEQSHKENDRLLKIMAHDLRNPIGATGSIAAVILEETELDEEHRRLLELVQKSAESSLEMITDLLHATGAPGNLQLAPVDMKDLLQYCIEQLRFKAEEKHQTLLLRAEPLVLSLDREKIWRVVSNLVTNAIKFSPSGTTITVELYRMDDEVRVSVTDEGIGIPKDIQEKLFDLPGQGRTGTSGEESFGLGLGISKQIAEAHGGRLWCETPAAGGTTFIMALPGKTLSSRTPDS